MPDERSAYDRLAEATGYPYPRPDGSFTWSPGAVGPWPDHGVADLRERTAVIAIGSNAAPSRLDRKHRRFGLNGPLPIAAATVTGIDCVFAAGIASYGSIPATVTDAPGTIVTTHLTLLDPDQLEAIDRSEGVPAVYDRIPIDPEQVDCPDVGPLPRVEVYRTVGAPLCVAGTPRRLSAIPAEHALVDAWSERHALDHVAGRLGIDVEVLVELAADERERRALNRSIAELRCPAH